MPAYCRRRAFGEVRDLATIEPRKMDQETLERFGAESWAETVLVRGVCVYGLILLIGFSFSSVLITGGLSFESLSFNFGVAFVIGAVFGTYLRYAVHHELRRRKASSNQR
jgi:hypothetical protein